VQVTAGGKGAARQRGRRKQRSISGMEKEREGVSGGGTPQCCWPWRYRGQMISQSRSKKSDVWCLLEFRGMAQGWGGTFNLKSTGPLARCSSSSSTSSTIEADQLHPQFRSTLSLLSPASLPLHLHLGRSLLAAAAAVCDR